ncbi:MAG: helix-turn-helix transcriptional regulator [Fimbriimonadaceae bacterium]|nr:helix-turn-helix transcriptional regulator [Fimbriimonadaceae bacterium]
MVANTWQESPLDAVFAALAHPVRREIVRRLKTGMASVNDFLSVFEMSGPAISKHLKVLEDAGLVRVVQDKQTRYRALNASPLAEATDWLEEYRIFWEGSFDRMESVARELEAERNNDQSSR